MRANLQSLLALHSDLSEVRRLKRKHNRGLLWIAALKTVKGFLLLMLAVGLLRLLHKDVQAWLENLVNALRIDPDNRYVAALLMKAGLVDDHRLAQVSGLTFLYAAMFLTEGVGLWFEKRWAEWFTVIVTGSFIPIEIYEIWKHCGALKLIVLGLNTAVVIYLISILRRKPSEPHSREGGGGVNR